VKSRVRLRIRPEQLLWALKSRRPTPGAAPRDTLTNGAGVYSFLPCNPGFYDVRVEQPGFRAAVSHIELQVQQTARIDFTLQVGQVNESVQVSATAVQLNTDDATVGTVIENRRIVDLPLNGRDYLQLVALSPNVSSGFANGGQSDSRQGGSRANEQLSVAGELQRFNYFTLDGGTTPTSISIPISSSPRLTRYRIQGADRHLSRRIRPRHYANQCVDQAGHQPVSRHGVRVSA
jgi:hypothetical protein